MKNNKNIPRLPKAALAAAGLHTGWIAQLVLAIVITSLAATAQAQNRTWTGGGADNLWSNPANWLNGDVPGNGSTLIWNASSTGNLVSFNDLNLSVATINYAAAPDGVVLNGNALTLTAGFSGPNPFTPNGITFNLDIALPADFQFAPNNFNYTVFNGVLSGGATLVTTRLTGLGVYAFYGANTFSGPVIIGANNGEGRNIINTLANSGVAQSLGTGSLVQFGRTSAGDRGFLYYTGGETSTDKGFQIGGNTDLFSGTTGPTGGVFANGTGAMTWSGTQTLATLPGVINPTTGNPGRIFTLGGFNTDANTWSSAIGDNLVDGTEGGPNSFRVALTKDGRGTWVLSGANTFTGALRVNSGRLVLDYAIENTVVPSGRAVTLGGGTLEFKAASSGSSAQTLGNVTVTNGTGLSTIRVNQNGGSGMDVTLGTVTTPGGSDTRAAVLYDLFGSGNSSFTIGNNIAPNTGTNGTQIIRTSGGAYDFAVNTGANTAISARDATTVLGANNGNANLDYLFTSTGSVGGGESGSAVAARSLRIAPTATDQTMTINNVGATAGGGTGGMLIAGGGLIYDGGAHDFTIAAAGTDPNGVSIRTGNSGSAFNLYHMGTGTLTIDERVYLAYTGTNTAVGLFGTGTGLIDWKGSTNQNSFRALTISGVTVRISGTTDPLLLDNTSTDGIRGVNPIILNGGGVLEAVNGNITRDVGTGRGQISWTGDGGFSAFGGDRAVSLASGGTLTWGATSFVPDGNALLLSSQYADSRIDFQNPLVLGGLQRLVQVANGSADVDARLSGILSGGLTGGLVKEGLGTLELTAANTYGGETWVRAGTLLVNGDQSAAKGLVTVFDGAAIGGSGTIGGNLTLAAGSFFAFDPTATLTVTGTVTLDNSFGINSLVGADWSTLTLGSPYTLIAGTGNFSSINNFGADNAEDVGGGRFAYFQEGSLQLVVIPEPGTLALVGMMGLALLAGLRRRK